MTVGYKLGRLLYSYPALELAELLDDGECAYDLLKHNIFVLNFI